jgi:hypothetical protein
VNDANVARSAESPGIGTASRSAGFTLTTG